jgi:uncharacterized protein
MSMKKTLFFHFSLLSIILSCLIFSVSCAKSAVDSGIGQTQAEKTAYNVITENTTLNKSSAAITVAGNAADESNLTKVCIRSVCFYVELADTSMEQSFGLMYRKSLDADTGMLFVFDSEEIHAFWMKNTLIPLDMIWMDSGRNIVYIYRNAQPCGDGLCPAINPYRNAKYVLEVNSGTADKYRFSVGDNAEIG